MTSIHASSTTVKLLIFIAAVLLYFLPMLVARVRQVDRDAGITALNLLLSWTVIGWMVALFLACIAETVAQRRLREAEEANLLDAMFRAPGPHLAAPWVRGPQLTATAAVRRNVRVNRALFMRKPAKTDPSAA